MYNIYRCVNRFYKKNQNFLNIHCYFFLLILVIKIVNLKEKKSMFLYCFYFYFTHFLCVVFQPLNLCRNVTESENGDTQKTTIIFPSSAANSLKKPNMQMCPCARPCADSSQRHSEVIEK